MTNTYLNDVSVLCVDNYIDALELLKLSLELRGAKVYTAVSMDEAMRTFDTQHPTILISDLALPQGSGITLMKAIRRQNAAMPAIALTGISDSQVRQQALDAGFDRYLVKPVDDQVLIQAVSALALKGRKLSAYLPHGFTWHSGG
jgi:CheY-like chemotaxis protein